MAALLTCHKNITFPPWWVRPATCITASLQLDELSCTAALLPSEEALFLTLAVTDENGNDVTKQYEYALSHPNEQDTVERFNGGDSHLATLLYRYRGGEEDGLRCAEVLLNTKTFRTLAARHVKSFIPEPINNRAGYGLRPTPEGRFILCGRQGREVSAMSETERKLFLYACFLNAVSFWEHVQELHDLHHERKPLLVTRFLEFLDPTADIGGLIKRTQQLDRQIIIFVPSVERINL